MLQPFQLTRKNITALRKRWTSHILEMISFFRSYLFIKSAFLFWYSDKWMNNQLLKYTWKWSVFYHTIKNERSCTFENDKEIVKINAALHRKANANAACKNDAYVYVGKFVDCSAFAEAANGPYINVLYANSHWCTDSQRIAFGCLPNACTSNVRIGFKCCVRIGFKCRVRICILFAFRCKPGFRDAIESSLFLA